MLLDKIRDDETLIVAKLDRLGRDAQDIGPTIKMLASRKIQVVVLQLDKLDLTSLAGKLMLNMLAVIAEMEHDLLIECTQSGLTKVKNEGKTLGRPIKTIENQRAQIMNRFKYSMSISELDRIYGLSRASILRVTRSK